MTCRHCGARVDTGLVLCELCQRKALDCFDEIPIHYGNLARWTPGRAGSRPVPGSRVLYDDSRKRDNPDRISDALDEAGNMLTTWARVLTDARPWLTRLLDRLAAANVTEAESVAWLCAGFRRYLTSVATLDWCGEFVRDLDQHTARLRALTSDAIPGWYAGACRHCGAATYVVPGMTWLTCQGCGTTSHAADHLDVVLDEARDWVAPPKRIAEAVVALIDTEPSVERLHDRIRQWGTRGRIASHRATDHDGDPTGPHRYQLGDVLAAIRSEAGAPTRASHGVKR